MSLGGRTINQSWYTKSNKFQYTLAPIEINHHSKSNRPNTTNPSQSRSHSKSLARTNSQSHSRSQSQSRSQIKSPLKSHSKSQQLNQFTTEQLFNDNNNNQKQSKSQLFIPIPQISIDDELDSLEPSIVSQLSVDSLSIYNRDQSSHSPNKSQKKSHNSVRIKPSPYIINAQIIQNAKISNEKNNNTNKNEENNYVMKINNDFILDNKTLNKINTTSSIVAASIAETEENQIKSLYQNYSSKNSSINKNNQSKSINNHSNSLYNSSKSLDISLLTDENQIKTQMQTQAQIRIQKQYPEVINPMKLLSHSNNLTTIIPQTATRAISATKETRAIVILPKTMMSSANTVVSKRSLASMDSTLSYGFKPPIKSKFVTKRI